jgi:flagellum-specific peptidoglycan hydrolase FlgJ
MRETTVPASVLLAQAVVESAWGERLLARDYHNLFAVEGTGPAGSVYLAAGGEAPPAPGNERQYRKYHHDGESIIDHARLLAKSEKYQAVMSVNDRPEIFARALSGRYSPLPHYGDTLVRIMRQFDLQRFDRAT